MVRARRGSDTRTVERFYFVSIYFFCITRIKLYHTCFILFILKNLKHDFYMIQFRENTASGFLVSRFITCNHLNDYMYLAFEKRIIKLNNT